MPRRLLVGLLSTGEKKKEKTNPEGTENIRVDTKIQKKSAKLLNELTKILNELTIQNMSINKIKYRLTDR